MGVGSRSATDPGTGFPVGLRVRLEEVSHTFSGRGGAIHAVEHLSLDVPAGSFCVVIGPNGCGKSTLLRLVAGLLVPQSGRVTIGDGPTAAPPRAGDGRIGLAFQQPRLMPWLTVTENVSIPLALAGVGPGERRLRAAAALERVGLGAVGHLRPAELSGGMAQRAGLARALISDPPILLLDEPFSALDALTREAFDTELQALWLSQRRTVIFVTHSVSEAIRLADRVVVMTARPGAVARLVDVDLPRPRPVQPGGALAAAADGEVRRTLAAVHPAELSPWAVEEHA